MGDVGRARKALGKGVTGRGAALMAGFSVPGSEMEERLGCTVGLGSADGRGGRCGGGLGGWRSQAVRL
eukprot:1687912-Pleurochrysis_carterae.AAC.1